ncbi:MAG: hypothetical protein AAFW89_01015 [Bacteroidota bacterium]
MKSSNPLFLVLPLVFLCLVSCSKSYSNLTIPAKQQFLLGETETSSFRVKLENKSDVIVGLETRTVDGEKTSGFGLDAFGTTRLSVASDEMAVLTNPSSKSIVVRVTFLDNVQGMRYEVMENYESEAKLDDLSALDELTGDAWTGSLTYKNYSDGTMVTIPARFSVEKLDAWSYTFSYIYPDEPDHSSVEKVVYNEADQEFDGRKILSSDKTSDSHTIRTIQKGTDNGEEVNLFYTYVFTKNKVVIKKEYQALGSSEREFRNEYTFYR